MRKTESQGGLRCKLVSGRPTDPIFFIFDYKKSSNDSYSPANLKIEKYFFSNIEKTISSTAHTFIYSKHVWTSELLISILCAIFVTESLNFREQRYSSHIIFDFQDDSNFSLLFFYFLSFRYPLYQKLSYNEVRPYLHACDEEWIFKASFLGYSVRQQMKRSALKQSSCMIPMFVVKRSPKLLTLFNFLSPPR